ncbi:hypothetical protein [Nocardia asiatica]|uniref:hypothetical protein n=1 Tax=Nocardia asiatica TaxID=209252 RepID=UPI002457F4F6|nr:hypothetical protein [Nocardia asiatica]
MTVVYEADVTVTMRGVDDPVGLPYTVHPVELAGREVLVEIRRGPQGERGPQGSASWPWDWQGDAATFAALQALGLGTADKRKAWRVVADNALYLWTGRDWIRFVSAFGSPGRQGAPNALTGVGVAGATGSSAAAEITSDAPGQTLAITMPRGATGDQGDPGEPGAISDAADVNAAGAKQDSVLAWTAPPGEFRPIPPPRLLGPWAIASGQFSGGSQLNDSPHTVATMTIPAQPIAWRPIVMSGSLAMLTHVSAIGETRVDVEIRLGAIDGALIGYGVGLGAANQYQVNFFPRYEYPAAPNTTTFGVVQPNQTATLYILARRVLGTRLYTIVNGGAQLIIMGQPLREQP